MMKIELNHFLALKIKKLTVLAFVLSLFSASLLAEETKESAIEKSIPPFLSGKLPAQKPAAPGYSGMTAGNILPSLSTSSNSNTPTLGPVKPASVSKASPSKLEPTQAQETTEASIEEKPKSTFDNLMNSIKSFSLLPKPGAKLADTEINRKECTNALNEKLKELTADSLDDTYAKVSDKYLNNLLDNQAELSFAKYSRAFIKAGYYEKLNGESEEAVLKKLEGMLSKFARPDHLVEGDVKVLQQFFNSVQNPTTGKGAYGFDKVSTALSYISKNDKKEYRLNRADVLIMNSLVHFNSPGKIKRVLKDRLLAQIRNVFHKRNAEADDLKRSEQVISVYKDVSKNRGFKSAKEAFVKKAKGVITKYVRQMGESCRKYFVKEGGKISFDSIPSDCSTKNYLDSLFSDDPLNNIETILEYINDNQLQWKGKKYISVAAVKLTPIKCEIKDRKVELTMNLKNVPRDFKESWRLSCTDCSTVELNNKNLEIEYTDTKTISFTGEAPKKLNLTNPNVNWASTVDLSNCKTVPAVQKPLTIAPEEKKKPEATTGAEASPAIKVEAVVCSKENEEPFKEKCVEKCPPSSTRNQETGGCIPDEEKDDSKIKECTEAGNEWNEETKECEDKIGCTVKNKAGECVTCEEDEVFDKEQDICVASESVDDLLTPDTKTDENEEIESSPQHSQEQSPLNLPQAQQIPIPADSFYIKAGFN